MKDMPPIILRRTKHGLEAVNQIDAETLDEIPTGQDVEVVFKKRRSGPQQRLYWKVLGEVVKATEKWANANKLHDEIKFSLGYVERCVSLTGAIYFRADSTAFAKMDGQEFKVFFDRAMKLIATHCGFDPLESYERMKAA